MPDDKVNYAERIHASIDRVPKRKRWKYQAVLIGDYINERTGRIKRNLKSFGKGQSPPLNYDTLVASAVRHGQGQLGGSNWILLRVKTIYWIVGRRLKRLPKGKKPPRIKLRRKRK